MSSTDIHLLKEQAKNGDIDAKTQLMDLSLHGFSKDHGAREGIQRLEDAAAE